MVFSAARAIEPSTLIVLIELNHSLQLLEVLMARADTDPELLRRLLAQQQQDVEELVLAKAQSFLLDEAKEAVRRTQLLLPDVVSIAFRCHTACPKHPIRQNCATGFVFPSRSLASITFCSKETELVF